jgi:hypothetical protein
MVLLGVLERIFQGNFRTLGIWLSYGAILRSPTFRMSNTTNDVRRKFYSSQEPELAVFIRKLGSQYQLITKNGRWIVVQANRIDYSIPGWLDSSLLEPLLPHLPSEPLPGELVEQAHILDFNVPREISAPVVVALGDFWSDVQTVYRRHATTLNNAYNILADKVNLRHRTLEDMARVLIGKEPLTPSALYAVRRAVHNGGSGFRVSPASFSATHMVQIRSQQQTEIISTAQQWIRQYRESTAAASNTGPASEHSQGFRNVDNFVAHARRLIINSRKRRDMLPGGIGPHNPPSSVFSLSHGLQIDDFEAHEVLLIQFMEFWCLQNLIKVDQHLVSLPAVILRATNMYPDLELNEGVGSLFLQEIGVRPPLVNRALLSTELLLPGTMQSVHIEQLRTLAYKNESNLSKTEDKFSHIRHDWKDLRVFCVDPDGAKEVDDGFSLEPVTGEPGLHWLRMHIANPTAFLQPTSKAAQLAKHMTETFYSPESVFSMLPPSISRETGVRQDGPTFTISAKVGQAGQILDIDIRPGIVRNVLHLTYDDLAEAMGEPVEVATHHVLGGVLDTVRKTPIPQFKKDDLKQLETIQSLAAALKQRRMRDGAGDFSEQMFAPHVQARVFRRMDKYAHAFPLHMSPTSDPAKSFHLAADPIIELVTQPLISKPKVLSKFSSKDIVGEMMVLAGEVAARWAWERKLPIIYRGQATRVPMGEVKNWGDEILEFLHSHENWSRLHGYIYASGMRPFYSLAYIGTKPSPHATLGVCAYTKATSPLRRYADMVNHWQIGSALLQEAKMDRSLVGYQGPRNFLMFTENEMESMIGRLKVRERVISKLNVASWMHWIAHYFFRAFYFKQAPLPDTFEVAILMDQPQLQMVGGGTVGRFIRVYTLDHSFPFFMERPETSDTIVDGTRNVQSCDIWEAAIKEVNVYRREVVLEPIRLLERQNPAFFDHEQKVLKGIFQSDEFFLGT